MSKVKIPKSVKQLTMSPKKFAKKHDIRLKGKGMNKKSKKRALKHLKQEYSKFAVSGLNRAVKIISENELSPKKLQKVTEGIDNILTNPAVMDRVIKIYNKHPEEYPHMMYLPAMIMNTIKYYSQDDLKDDEKEVGKSLDIERLSTFCQKILKRNVKRYRALGIDKVQAYILATAIPSTKHFKNNRDWYRRTIAILYELSEDTIINVDEFLSAIRKVDKKNKISKKEFEENFYREFILQRKSSKMQNMTDSQKSTLEDLTMHCLDYMEGLKYKRLRAMLRGYINNRKHAEKYKTDGKRVIKFVDYANNNSPYSNIKRAVQDLIEDDGQNELYLG